eukprot:1158578-Pelagomonas_calceolata.AAC.1
MRVTRGSLSSSSAWALALGGERVSGTCVDAASCAHRMSWEGGSSKLFTAQLATKIRRRG